MKIALLIRSLFFFCSLLSLAQMAWGVSCVDTTLNKSFYKLGKIIGRNPGYFVIIPVLLTLLCITGWVFFFYFFSQKMAHVNQRFPIQTIWGVASKIRSFRKMFEAIFRLFGRSALSRIGTIFWFCSKLFIWCWTIIESKERSFCSIKERTLPISHRVWQCYDNTNEQHWFNFALFS